MNTVFLFLAGVGFQELVAVFLTLGICILIFLTLRALMLWYWKINSIVENQEEQIKLLKELVSTLDTGVDRYKKVID